MKSSSYSTGKAPSKALEEEWSASNALSLLTENESPVPTALLLQPASK